jgi:hypothetical protein
MNSTNYKLSNSLKVLTACLLTTNLSFVWILVDGTRNYNYYPDKVFQKIVSGFLKVFPLNFLFQVHQKGDFLGYFSDIPHKQMTTVLRTEQ